MAKFVAEPPKELIKEMEELNKNVVQMCGEMTQAGAQVSYKEVLKNMDRAFKHSAELKSKVTITKVYNTPSDGGINTKVGVYGYIKQGKMYKIKNSYKSKNGKTYEYDGIAAPFVVIQRDFGNSRNEAKMPILRTAFKPSKIDSAMLKVQEKYIKE